MFRSGKYPDDAPKPPSQAYRAVEQVVHPSFFVKSPPPPTGRKLVVTGLDDRVTTYWEMDEYSARFIYEQLRDTNARVHCSSANYDNRER